MSRVILTRRHPAYRKIRFAAVLLLVFLGITAVSLYGIRESRLRTQTQTDPHVATVWILGVATGAQPSLTHGTPLQKWLNGHGIHALGDYRVLTSRFSGDHDSLEIWFDYHSFLPNQPNLECHRVGETAFMDDLGQHYHGYLDFQDKYVGVYLPGYDHAARRLTCALHWMPRQPAPAHPVSDPMVFTIDLPPTPRVLPPAASLARGPVSATSQGITVTAGWARLSTPNFGMLGGSQRELSFRLKVQGGNLANANVDPGSVRLYTQGNALVIRRLNWMVRRSLNFRNRMLFRLGPPPGIVANPSPSSAPPFHITDPYGISLLSESETLSPLPMLNPDDPQQAQYGTVWVAPVNGAGRGTDAVHLHFDVMPTVHTPSTKPVPFDITLPVETGDEV